MEYRSLGRTGLKVSALCLGAGKFGGAAPEADCARIIDRALDAGINFIDTAYVYGESEAIIGRALKASGRRGEMLIATKIQPMANDRSTIIAQCTESLRRLQTDVIDLLMLHRPNPDIPIDESLRALDDLVRAGKVRYIGTSAFKGWQIVESIYVARELGLNRFVSEQSVYSLLARGIEVEVIPACRTYGVGLMLWSPLGAGVLTDRYSRAGRSGRANPPKHVELSEREWRVVEAVQAMAREKGCTASQLAAGLVPAPAGRHLPDRRRAHGRAVGRQPGRAGGGGHRRGLRRAGRPLPARLDGPPGLARPGVRPPARAPALTAALSSPLPIHPAAPR